MPRWLRPAHGPAAVPTRAAGIGRRGASDGCVTRARLRRRDEPSRRRRLMRLGLRGAAAILAALGAACATMPRGVEQPPNILLITADSLRADRIDWSGGRTPALAALARRGTRFTRAY